MKVIVVVSFILFLTVQSQYCNPPLPQVVEHPGYVMFFVQTISRHGDRAPMTILDNDTSYYECTDYDNLHIHTSNSFSSINWKGNCEPFQLTLIGVNQLKTYGYYERTKYVKE